MSESTAGVSPTIVSNTVDEEANHVLVGVEGDVPAVQRFYDSRFGPGFVKVQQEAPEVAARNTHRTPSRGGLLIGRTAANDETCTTSFIGREGNTRWLLTAGHCAGNVGLPQIFQGGVQINPLERVNVGSINGNPRADVGVINLVPALWSSWVFVSAAQPAAVIRRNHGLTAVQGGAVQLSLGRSNVSVLATVINADRDITVASGAYGNYQLFDTKQVDRAIVGGDSGSPVFQADIAEGVMVTTGGSYVQIVNQLTGARVPALNVP